MQNQESIQLSIQGTDVETPSLVHTLAKDFPVVHAKGYCSYCDRSTYFIGRPLDFEAKFVLKCQRCKRGSITFFGVSIKS